MGECKGHIIAAAWNRQYKTNKIIIIMFTLVLLPAQGNILKYIKGFFLLIGLA